jgi:uncharacterized protein YciI
VPLFVVRFHHPDAEGWQQQLMPHVAFLQQLLREGSLKASGPLPDAADKAALLLIEAPDRPALDAIVARDPFAEHGLIANLIVEEWDPLFGVFNALSSMPGQLQD